MTYAIYVTSNQEYGFIDQETFETLRAGTLSAQLTDIAIDADGNIFGIGFGTLYRLDLTIGEAGLSANLTSIGSLSDSATFNALEFNDRGQLFAANARGFFEVDLNTASLSLVAPLPSASAGDIVFNQRTGDYYIATSDSSIYQWNGNSDTVVDTGFDVPQATFGLTIVNDVLHSYYGNDAKLIDLVSGSESFVMDLAMSGSIYGASSISAQAVETIARLYLATFDRAPDAAGMEFWMDVYQDDTGLQDIATLFANSTEFEQRFGSDVDNAAFVDVVYQNVLGRPGEADGVSFWRGALDSGTERSDVLLYFADSPENRARSEDIVSNAVDLLDPLASFAAYLEVA